MESARTPHTLHCISICQRKTALTNVGFFPLLSTLCHFNSLKDKLEAARVLFSSFDRLQMRALVIVTFDPHSGYIHATPALFDDFCRLFSAHRYESCTDSRGIRRIRKTFIVVC